MKVSLGDTKNILKQNQNCTKGAKVISKCQFLEKIKFCNFDPRWKIPTGADRQAQIFVFHHPKHYYLRQSRQVIERWEFLLLFAAAAEVMTSKVTKGQGQLFFAQGLVEFYLLSSSPTLNFLWGGIHWSLCLGSIRIFCSSVINQISLWGEI